MVSVEEYLNTAYDPDLEFVDGVLVERNVGGWLHSLVQSNVLFALRRKYPHLKVVAELRSSVTGTRFHLPDVCVLLTFRTSGLSIRACQLLCTYRPTTLVEGEGDTIRSADGSVELTRGEIFAE
uniref:Uncharacterized protein n=1 Tax=Solibacter usitatus (strain Ellin6076) TaxID=234267 RepID=Q01QH3_SOLUE